MRSRCFRLSSSLLASLLAAPIAVAQWSPSASVDMGMNYGQMALGQSAIGGTRALGKSGRRAFDGDNDPAGRATAEPPAEPPAATKTPAFDPVFKSAAAVSHRVNQRFARYLAGDDPQQAARAMDELEAGAYRRAFKQLLARNGLATNDLVDVTAMHYAALWEVVHDGRLGATQVAAIRNQLRHAMRSEPSLAGLDDAAKQEIAETLMLHTAAAVDGYRSLRERGDRRMLVQFRQGVQRNLLPEGPDLRQLDVAANGFSARRPAAH